MRAFFAQHRTDRNHAEIRDAFLALHCSVHDTSMVGGGFPDLVVGINTPRNGRVNLLIEVKPSNDSVISKAQMEFHRAWRGRVVTVWNTSQVVDLVQEIRMRECR